MFFCGLKSLLIDLSVAIDCEFLLMCDSQQLSSLYEKRKVGLQSILLIFPEVIEPKLMAVQTGRDE